MSALEALAIAVTKSLDEQRSSTQAAILEAAKAGDLAAFEALMRQYQRLVLATALRLTASMPDAQDVSQEVFLKLHRNLRKIEASGTGAGDSVAAWLYRVTVNACRDLQ